MAAFLLCVFYHTHTHTHTELLLLLLVFLFWDSYDSNVGAFNIVPEVSEVVLISFNSFFFFLL